MDDLLELDVAVPEMADLLAEVAVILIAPEIVMVFVTFCKCRFLLVDKRYVLKSKNNKLNKYFF